MSNEQVNLMFRAFSDPTRLRILHLLQAGELCVGDLVDVLQAPQPRVSRHLAYLRKAGLVVARKDGLWAFYSLAPARSTFHKYLLDCVTCCLGDVPELQADAERAAGVKAAGGCCPDAGRKTSSCRGRSSGESPPSPAPLCAGPRPQGANVGRS